MANHEYGEFPQFLILHDEFPKYESLVVIFFSVYKDKLVRLHTIIREFMKA